MKLPDLSSLPEWLKALGGILAASGLLVWLRPWQRKKERAEARKAEAEATQAELAADRSALEIAREAMRMALEAERREQMREQEIGRMRVEYDGKLAEMTVLMERCERERNGHAAQIEHMAEELNEYRRKLAALERKVS